MRARSLGMGFMTIAQMSTTLATASLALEYGIFAEEILAALVVLSIVTIIIASLLTRLTLGYESRNQVSSLYYGAEMSHEKMSVKKLVSYSMFALGAARLTFSLAQHLAGHEVTLIEVFEALPFLSAGVVLYATDVHKTFVSVSRTMYKSVELKSLDAFNYGVARFFRRLSQVMYKYSELKGIDALNYFIANLTVSFSQRFRKTHTGVLSYNMLAVLIGIILLLILLFLFGEYIP